MKTSLLIAALCYSVSTFSQDLPKVMKSAAAPLSTPSGLSSSVSMSPEPGALPTPGEDDIPLSRSYKALTSLAPDKGVSTRGVRDAALFRNLSPSVVLIVSKDSLGSGSIIGNQGETWRRCHYYAHQPR